MGIIIGTILTIIFAPLVTVAGIKMALDMNRPRRRGRHSRRRRWR